MPRCCGSEGLRIGNLGEVAKGFQDEKEGLKVRAPRGEKNAAIGDELEDGVGDTATVEGAHGLVVDVSEVLVVEDVEVLVSER